MAKRRKEIPVSERTVILNDYENEKNITRWRN